MADPRIEGRKRGAPSRRRGATSSTMAGITTAAIETGVAIAAKYGGSTLYHGNLQYVIEKTGVPILLARHTIDPGIVNTLQSVPCVVGVFEHTPTMFLAPSSFKHALETVSLYSVPMEFQFVSNAGIGRFCIPYSKNVNAALLDINDIVKSTMQVSGQRRHPFLSSAELVAESVKGESYFVPWGSRSLMN